ncbi:MAG TPA: hypothetical protein VFS08_12650, partial [Gemmatimonadaceae bacterium]|nr:hypothetical protein [Gemmatimonadaceae bacterium]
MAATGHDVHAAADYRRLRRRGIRVAREGIRWHRVEPSTGRFDFSDELARVRAAHEAGITVIWDLCHFGWPDDVDVFSAAFVDRLARLAGAFARLVASEVEGVPFYTPVNEISFVAWAGGRAGYLNPF